MVVRVKLAVTSGEGRPVGVVALANGGYEFETAELALPVKIAGMLGLRQRIKTAKKEKYFSASGSFTVVRLPRVVKVQVEVEDRNPSPVEADAIMAANLDEVLLSDHLITVLGNVILDPAMGRWRFRDDPPEKVQRT